MPLKPCNVLPIFRTFGIGEYLQILIVAWHPPAVLRRTGAFAADASGILDRLVFQQNALKKDFM